MNDTGSASTATLSEVVVTAEKRTGNVQKTPISVTAVTGDTLLRQGVDDVLQLNKVVPSLQVFNNTGAVVVSIRGVRSSDFGPTAESPAAVHLDGVYLSRPVGLTGLFYDLQRVEVVAGPQGTLFGRNAVAGVLNIVTNKPTSTFGADAELELGTHDLVRAQAALNLPVSDTLAVRLAGQSYTHSGYYKNGLDDADQRSGRVEILWKPTSKDQILLTADYSQIGGRGPSDTPVNPKDTNPALVGLTPVTADLRDNSIYYGDGSNARIDETVWGLSAQYDHNFQAGDAIVEYGHRNVSATNYLLQGSGYGYIPQRDHTDSLEARFVSPANRLVDYVAGLFYFQERVFGDNQSFFCVTCTPANNMVVADVGNPLQTTRAFAAFGQATLNLAAWHATLGVRYSDDQKTATTYTHFGPPPYLDPFHGSGEWSRMTYKASVSYDVTPTSLVYGTISTGFKAGGFAYGASPRYNPESIIDYEVGSKNRFFNNKVQINLEAYDYEYKNFEVIYFEPIFVSGNPYPFFTLFATNAGTARVYGAGVTADWAPTADDRASINVQYSHAQYGTYDLTALGLPDYSGADFPNAPHWQGQASYTHTFHLGQSTLDARADLQYGGRRNDLLSPRPPTDVFPAIYQDAYAIGDLSVRYTPRGGRWSATAYVHNVGDTTYASPYNLALPAVFASLDDPRVVGVILGAHF